MGYNFLSVNYIRWSTQLFLDRRDEPVNLYQAEDRWEPASFWDLDAFIDYLMVRIRTINDTEGAWRKAVDIFLRRNDTGFVVVGIDREI